MSFKFFKLCKLLPLCRVNFHLGEHLGQVFLISANTRLKRENLVLELYLQLSCPDKTIQNDTFCQE